MAPLGGSFVTTGTMVSFMVAEAQPPAAEMTRVQMGTDGYRWVRVIAAANHLSAILEAAGGPRGLKHPRHSRHIAPARAKAEAVIREYFSRQEAYLLAEIRPKVRSALVAHPKLQEAASTAAYRFASTLLPTSLHPLRFPVTQDESSEWNDAIRAAINGAGLALAKEIQSGAQLSEDVAGRYLRDHSLSKLTGGFSETSVDRLRAAVAEAWDAGGSYDQIVAAIQKTFADFSDVRAGMIAQTEVNDAYVSGRAAMADELGFDEKSWDTDGGACEICQANADQGWIDMDEDFSSGDDAPTAHPNCDCSLSFRKSSSSE